MGKGPEQKFLQKRMQVVGECMSRCLAAPVIGEVHLHTARMATILTYNNYQQDECGGSVCLLQKTGLQFFKNIHLSQEQIVHFCVYTLKTYHVIYHSNFVCVPERIVNDTPKKYVCIHTSSQWLRHGCSWVSIMGKWTSRMWCWLRIRCVT